MAAEGHLTSSDDRITDNPKISLFRWRGATDRRRLPRYRSNGMLCHYVPCNCGHPRGGGCLGNVVFHNLGRSQTIALKTGAEAEYS